jgi:HEAT repeat protein
MTKRRALWLAAILVVLAAFSLLVPASPAYLPELVSRGYFGHYYDGHGTGYWSDALRDPDVEVRHHALTALGAMGADASDAVPALAVVLLEDPDRENRSRAALALSKMAPASRSAVPALAVALRDEEPFVRMNAATALFQLRTGAHEAVPALIQAFQDDINSKELPGFWVSIGEMMALALGRDSAGSEDGVAVLQKALADATTTRRRYILARALGEIGFEARPAAPQLRALLADKDEDVRRIAQDSLMRIGEGPSAAPVDPAPAPQD